MEGITVGDIKVSFDVNLIEMYSFTHHSSFIHSQIPILLSMIMLHWMAG
jgi:hypothetical protein